MVWHWLGNKLLPESTRTPLFWGYPPPNFWILKQTLHATHLLKLLDKMCKYEMDPTSIVEDTEQTRFSPQTDGQMDGRCETSIPPFQLRWSEGYNDESVARCMYMCTTRSQCGNTRTAMQFHQKHWPLHGIIDNDSKTYLKEMYLNLESSLCLQMS